MQGFFDRAQVRRVLALTRSAAWPSAPVNGVGTWIWGISRLNSLPMRAPVNASPDASRRPAHDSGSGWFAKPSLYDSFIRYSCRLTGAF